MVAIHSLDRAPRSLLRKAAWLARSRGVGMRLVHIIALPYGPLAVVRANVRGAARGAVKDAKAGLLKLAGSAELRGLAMTSTVSWDYPAANGIIRQVGAVSRSALKRVFIGHTAEQVIDELRCDVLIVKPRGFKSSVAPRIRRSMALSAA
jgi:nucleotide-binding universal stress UspA family protein